MPAETEKTRRCIEKVWASLKEEEKRVLLYFFFVPKPVSVDTLSYLSGASVTIVLNVMENLKRKGIATEGKERGIYFMKDSNYFFEGIEKEGMDEIARNIINYYRDYPIEEEKKILLFAELHTRFLPERDGLKIVKKAADILKKTGKRAKALFFYDHILKFFSSHKPEQNEIDIYLDSIIGKVRILSHRSPVPEQIRLLKEAKELAKKHRKSERLAIINLMLARAMQDMGEFTKASSYLKSALRLLKTNKELVRSASHLLSEYYAWKGMFSTATRYYEEMIGNLEEFENDEEILMATQLIGFSHVICGRVHRGLGMIEAVRTKANILNLEEVIKYCDQAYLISYLEMRKIEEAEPYLNRLSSYSQEELGHILSWALNIHKAYILCMKGDYQGSFESLKKGIEILTSSGRNHTAYPWFFETLSILESKGLVLDSFSLDFIIKKTVGWDDIYAKGVALRHRAIKEMEEKRDFKKALNNLKKSEAYLEKSGAQFELARTRIALGRLFLQKKEMKKAKSYLSKAWDFLSTIDKGLFPEDLLYMLPQEQKLELMIERMTRINESLGTIKDMSVFLEKVINVAIDFTMAMRGAFIISEDKELKILASRNLDSALFKMDRFKELRDIIFEVMEKKGEYLCSAQGSQKEEPFILMPAKIGEEIMGYLLLHGRIDRKPFPSNQIPFIRMLCSQIAVGLSNIRTYEEIKEQRDRLKEEIFFYRREMGIVEPEITIVGRSESIKRILAQIKQVAPTDSVVLIQGETGVGKELIAKAIHSLSRRKDGPFISINLASLPEDLVASELFGHEKGAFTGAYGLRKGRFELADGGTIFLDEIGDLPPSIQVKLLRILEDGVFERLGGERSISSDFRVIAATNKDLLLEVEKGRFRKDLYYRLNVFPIYVPPLRERKEDIPLLAYFFLEKYCKMLGKNIRFIPASEMRKLLEYPWPGNVRELKHVIERCVILSDGHTISFSSLKMPSFSNSQNEDLAVRSLKEIEKEYILKILNITGWRISGTKGAAKLLDLKPSTLRFKMKKLGIRRPSPS